MLKLAVPRAEGDAGAAAVETMSKDMDITGLFQVLDPASFPAQLQSEGLGFSSALWTQVGAQAVIKMKASGGQLEGRVYVVARGDQPTLSKSYRDADIRDAVHEFANDVVQSFTGKRGVFGSRIAFAMSGRGAHEIGAVDMDGGRMARADEDGLRQPAAGVFARRRRDRVHLVRAQQPGPLDRRRRAAAARGACRSSPD